MLSDMTMHTGTAGTQYMYLLVVMGISDTTDSITHIYIVYKENLKSTLAERRERNHQSLHVHVFTS